ncbi:MAG: putative toxin-antitoxin system toxin component, PIN family [bacterium]
MIRAVLDTNVLVSALLSAAGAPAALIRAWQDGAFELVTSPLLIEELRGVLARPKIRRFISEDGGRGFIRLLEAQSWRAEDPVGPERLAPDPQDDFVIALALAEGGVLVTGDARLRSQPIIGHVVLEPHAFRGALNV